MMNCGDSPETTIFTARPAETIFMGTAGVITNARVGDPAYGWAADHVEPAVSIRNREDGPEHALHYLACIGNTATMDRGPRNRRPRTAGMDWQDAL